MNPAFRFSAAGQNNPNLRKFNPPFPGSIIKNQALLPLRSKSNPPQEIRNRSAPANRSEIDRPLSSSPPRPQPSRRCCGRVQRPSRRRRQVWACRGRRLLRPPPRKERPPRCGRGSVARCHRPRGGGATPRRKMAEAESIPPQRLDVACVRCGFCRERRGCDGEPEVMEDKCTMRPCATDFSIAAIMARHGRARTRACRDRDPPDSISPLGKERAWRQIRTANLEIVCYWITLGCCVENILGFWGIISSENSQTSWVIGRRCWRQICTSRASLSIFASEWDSVSMLKISRKSKE